MIHAEYLRKNENVSVSVAMSNYIVQTNRDSRFQRKDPQTKKRPGQTTSATALDDQGRFSINPRDLPNAASMHSSSEHPSFGDELVSTPSSRIICRGNWAEAENDKAVSVEAD